MVPIEILRSLPYFAGVSGESLKALAAIAEDHEFKAGETLWREGEPVHWLYIVRQGQIDIIYHFQSGKECIVDTVVAGELSGWSAVVEPYRHTATCIAREAGRVLCFQAVGVRQLCDKDSLLGYRLMIQVARTLSSRLQGARLQLAASS